MTIELDRMVELAHALQPAQRTPIRLPMSVPNVPPAMPLAEINIDKSEYGTTLTFAPCGRSEVSGAGHCVRETESLSVQIWPDDGYYGHIQEQKAVPMKIGGRDGIFNEAADEAGVQVQPGMLVVFEFGGPGPAESSTNLKDILAGVAWSPDPNNEATWPAVSDWAKFH